jgi:hypothetical protein
MRQVEHFRWLVPPTKPRGKPRLTTYHLSRSEAAERLPGATPVMSSLEVRPVYGNRDEANAARGNIGAGIVAAGGGAP